MAKNMTIYQIDAFTDRAFSGNPAGVCILQEPISAVMMQQLATEMNISETAFVLRYNEVFDLRWFTPAVEVDLCGHATLASAHILWEIGASDFSETIRFSSRSGELRASRKGEWIELDFPVEPPRETEAPGPLLQALDVQPQWVGKNRFDYLVEVDSEERVRTMCPDFSLLVKVPCRGVIVTSAAHTGEYDFVSRFFAPAVGVDEDPVTGSAHCCLAPYWQNKLGREPLTAFQASKRGGVLMVRVRDQRTFMSGKAVTVLKCELMKGAVS